MKLFLTTFLGVFLMGQFFAEQKVSLVRVGGSEMDIVEAARTSYFDENREKGGMTPKDEKLIKRLLNNKHWSPFEMVDVVFQVKCPLPIAAQWHRHWSWHFNEMSRRFTSKDIQFFVPEFRVQDQENKQASGTFLPNSEDLREYYHSHCLDCLEFYNSLLDRGVSREQARFVLPQGTMTVMVCKATLRDFIHFYKARSSPDAQAEIQWIADECLRLIFPHFPITLGEII